MAVEPFAVSVVIPAYNESARIAAAVAAIRAQTHAPQEIIVVDDGSRDSTAQVASSLGLRVIRQANGGISAARNTGIRAATAPWVAFCDADDRWDRRFLEYARTANACRPEAGFIFADHRTDIGGKIAQASMFAASPAFALAGGTLVGDGILAFERNRLAKALACANFIAPSTAIVRRDVVEGGIYFGLDLPKTSEYVVAEDIEWYLRVLTASDALGIDRVLLTYARRAGSVSDDAGRVNYGNVKLGELIAAQPERYVAGLAQEFAASRRRHIHEAALCDARSYRFARARKRLAEAQGLQFRMRDLVIGALIALASLPGGRPVLAAVRRAWSAALKPTLRALRREPT